MEKACENTLTVSQLQADNAQLRALLAGVLQNACALEALVCPLAGQLSPYRQAERTQPSQIAQSEDAAALLSLWRENIALRARAGCCALFYEALESRLLELTDMLSRA